MLHYIKRGALFLVLPWVLGYSFAACSGALRTIDEVNAPSDDAKLAECRALARADMQIYDDPDRAWNVYQVCKKDAGL